MRRALLGAFAAALALSSALGAQDAPKKDSLIPNKQLFHKSDLLVAGGFVAGTLLLLPVDKQLTRSFRLEASRENGSLDRVAKAGTWLGGPGTLIIGSSMFVVGRLGRVPKMAELALHGTEAVVVGTLTANFIKGVVGRARPYATADSNSRDFGFGRGFGNNRDYKAFPSGHASSAFAAAAAVVTETHEWWPQSTWYVAPVMYGGATIIGMSRIYNDQHWASDVLMGAAIGTFAGLKVVRFNHTHAGNMVDRIFLGTKITPTPNGTALSYSLDF
jgi:membrane-associated phospholipid phosphatase